MNTATNADETVRVQVQQLWNANFLNVRRATETIRQQGRSRLDIGLELLDVTFDNKGDFMPGAKDCLSFLAQSPQFGLHLWTLAPVDKVQLLKTTKLDPAHIALRGHNQNPMRTNLAWDPRKPWFDILLDHTSGFDPLAGQWYWAHHLFHAAAKSLSSMISGTTVIRSTDRFNVTPDPALKRQHL